MCFPPGLDIAGEAGEREYGLITQYLAIAIILFSAARDHAYPLFALFGKYFGQSKALPHFLKPA
jgi:hypothetical protein